MKFSKRPINGFPLEAIHGIPNSRRVLVKTSHTKNIDAITKAFLKPGFCWDWHFHDQIDEVGIVVKGTGKFGYKGKEKLYRIGDVIRIPTNSLHRWEAVTYSEFFFIRIKL